MAAMITGEQSLNTDGMRKKMKSFNLYEIISAGGKCKTRDGRSVRIICSDLDASQPVVAAVTKSQEEGERVWHYCANGYYYDGNSASPFDLVPAIDLEESEGL